MTDIQKRTWWNAVVGLLAALTLLLGACGGDDDTASGDRNPAADDGGDSEPSDAGSGGEPGDSDGGSSDADADDDFPIPRPDGLVLDALADSGIDSPGQRQLYYEDGDFDRVVAFYDDWTTEDGGWTRSESAGSVVFSGSDTERVRTISIKPGHDPGAQADGPVTYVLLIEDG